METQVPVVEVDQVRKVYGDVVALDGVSLRIQRGEVVGILGPNGAGKTTTVECVVGLRRPDLGRVRVFGLDPATGLDGVAATRRLRADHPGGQSDRAQHLRRGHRHRPSGPGGRRRIPAQGHATGGALPGDPGCRPGQTVLAPKVAARLLGHLRTPATETPSDRELEVLALVARGCTNRAIATRLHISEATVKTHLVHVFAKLGVDDRTAAVTVTLERGLLKL